MATTPSATHQVEPLPTSVAEIADLARRAEQIASHDENGLLVVMLRNPTDFAEYTNRIGDPERTTVWADVKAGTITAVINDHHHWADGGWRDHTATLALQPDERLGPVARPQRKATVPRGLRRVHRERRAHHPRATSRSPR